MFQDYKLTSVRSAAILTTSYVAGTVLPDTLLVGENNQLVLLVQFTLGSLTDGRIKIEFSPDGTTYYQETFGTISTGTETDTLGEHVMTASGNYRIPVQVKDRYVKISAKGTGTVTSSSMTIDAVQGTA